MIPAETVREILDRTDLVQLIGSYVTLRRAGSNLNGLCPFHSERTPSFTVFPSNNSFYCFGCGAGGDAISFIRRMENLDYPDAVEFLGKRVGITVVHTEDRDAGRSGFDRRRMLELNRAAAAFFHASLYKNTPGAHAALDYLKVKRGLSDATIRHFGLGFAPDSYRELTDHLLGDGYSFSELSAAFLSGLSQYQKPYDLFRNRVMFPIIDVSGNVIAFGGRVMDDSQPKYKNSSDTPVFKKSRNLFALNFAKNTCAEQLILCEGYMDVIALHAAGFSNAVATLGTAITPEQARLISKYTKSVAISYDMDEAGRRAADKATSLLEEVGVSVRLLVMQDAKDPDEFIKKFGADAFKSVLESGHTKFDYHLHRILKKYRIENAQERVQALGELIDLIAGFYSEAERDVYIGIVAQKLGVERSSVRTDVARTLRKRERQTTRKTHDQTMQSLSGYSDPVNPDFARAPAIARAEEVVLGMLLLFPELRRRISGDKPVLDENDFYTAFNRRVFLYIRQVLLDDPDDSEHLNRDFTTEEIGRITRMKVRRMELSDNSETVFLESVQFLKDALRQKNAAEAPPTLETLQSLLNQKRNQQP